MKTRKLLVLALLVGIGLLGGTAQANSSQQVELPSDILEVVRNQEVGSRVETVNVAAYERTSFQATHIVNVNGEEAFQIIDSVLNNHSVNLSSITWQIAYKDNGNVTKDSFYAKDSQGRISVTTTMDQDFINATVQFRHTLAFGEVYTYTFSGIRGNTLTATGSGGYLNAHAMSLSTPVKNHVEVIRFPMGSNVSYLYPCYED